MTNRRTVPWYNAKFEKAWSPERRLRRRATEARMRPRKLRDHKAARVIRARRRSSYWDAADRRHVRWIAKFGTYDGHRCLDCHHIPPRPWEPTDRFGAGRWCCQDHTVGALTCAVK